MPKIPEGWNDYTSIGKRIPETRFICFKVPLQKSLSAEHRFTPDDLIKSLAERHLSLGLVIDLTNTNKYYNPQCFTKVGIGHVKINVAGRVVPEPAVNKQFARSVEKFMEENGDNDKLIGVHCTHGLNRTGYVVCKHMIEHMAFTPEKALEVFNTARGHCVERDNFIDALHGRPYVDPPMDNNFTKPKFAHHSRGNHGSRFNDDRHQHAGRHHGKRRDFEGAGDRNHGNAGYADRFHRTPDPRRHVSRGMRDGYDQSSARDHAYRPRDNVHHAERDFHAHRDHLRYAGDRSSRVRHHPYHARDQPQYPHHARDQPHYPHHARDQPQYPHHARDQLQYPHHARDQYQYPHHSQHNPRHGRDRHQYHADIDCANFDQRYDVTRTYLTSHGAYNDVAQSDWTPRNTEPSISEQQGRGYQNGR